MSDTAKRIVDAILADFTDRRGLRQAWDSIDKDIQDEIRSEWESLTDTCLKVQS